MDNHPFTKASLGLYRPLAVVFALMLVAGLVYLLSAPAYADKDRDRGRGRGHQQRDDRHNDHRHDDYGHNDGYRHREWRDADCGYIYRPYYPQPYLYAQPVYVPPPVYYAPRPSPGISLFFPLDLR